MASIEGNARFSRQLILLAGDVVTLGLVTVYGFASHGEVGSAGSRMLIVFFPLVLSWLLVAPFLGAYDVNRSADPRQLWRPFWAMVLAGPLAAWMRGMVLNAPIIPIFVIVLGGVSALALLAWRVIYWIFAKRMRTSYG